MYLLIIAILNSVAINRKNNVGKNIVAINSNF